MPEKTKSPKSQIPDSLSLEPELMSAADLEASADVPLMTDPGWSEYVLSHFESNEVDSEGNPFVSGLRRVARLLIGPILSSKCRIIAAPQFMPGLIDVSSPLTVTTVEYSVVFMWCRSEDLAVGEGARMVEFSDVADVYIGNTDPEYARFPSSTAATRAEARCLRKALQLQRVVAAEEITKVPLEEATGSEITQSQITFIGALCQRCNINVVAYINSGKKKYDNISDVPHSTASRMVQHLSTLQSDQSKIPEDVRGYDANWRK